MFVSVFLISGCQSKKEEVTNSETQGQQNKQEGNDLLPMAENGEGYAFGLYNGEEIEDDRTFKIDTNSFTRTIKVDNKTKVKEKLLLLIFDADKQVTYDVNNKRENHYTFDVDANAEASVEVTIPTISKGYHPLYFIVVRSPYKEMKSLKEDLSYQQVFNTKVNVLKDIQDIPAPNEKYSSVASKTNSPTIDGVFIGEKKNPYSALLKEELSKDNNLRYQVTYGNKTDKKEDVYVVSLLNWKQVPISKEEDTIYDRLSPDTEKTFSSQLNGKLPKKENILTTLLLPEPYAPVEDNASLLFDVALSNRTIVVEK
ncbi:hypothetical protein M3592_27060 [Priestia aryabhattai]|uniref:hypothetical protein n=1 Tax=Priestia TaxID=2800373 RepID=UPI00203C8A90|nr:hypothetical protein [Priestia aryabhattai]MCM2979066.1 hypothetical protein [Priestia aryabhattai]